MASTQTGPPTTVTRQRRRLVVRGVVQGVGFRPHVVGLAEELGLVGHCRNDATCVVVEVEGAARSVAEFERRVAADAPPLARVEDVQVVDLAPEAEPAGRFVITESTSAPGERTMVPPDTAPCAACLAELADPADRRYRHPFITCTHCGPRLTITLDLPYDRSVTTMAPFPLCAACAEEYGDPRDRRYHAQPVSCHACGPIISARDGTGRVVASGTEATLAAAVAALRDARIVAIKGLGGYHLACDAADPAAVATLRARKHRPDRPLAVMVRDLATARRCVEVGGAAPLLEGPERPIVLLPARPDAPVAGNVAPGLDELGVLLPYTPLHHLLFADDPDGRPGAPPTLVMTSGNVSGEPLCHTDVDALERLGGIADLLVVHDRDIAVPCEDSVVAWSDDGGGVPVRRSRGFAPLPVRLPQPDAPGGVVLAVGAELKNTVALARDGRAFVSAHVGDLESLAARSAHRKVVDQLLRFHRSAPALVVADRHPGYASRAIGCDIAEGLGVPLHQVQHHHAHLASLAAEHGRLEERVLGLVFDGTGYGCPAGVWGGELLLLTDEGLGFQRLGHLGVVRLPGGDQGVRNPVRTAALALLAAGQPLAGTAVAEELSDAERGFLEKAHESGLGAVDTSSVGRLFDVVASVLGVRHRVTYEAQAAIELEAAARRWRRSHPHGAVPSLPFPRTGAGTERDPVRMQPAELVAAVERARREGAEPGGVAWAFHAALADTAASAAAQAARSTGVGVVGLTGGVFVNRILLTLTSQRLRAGGLEVLVHRRAPANDGGLALGQAAVGARHLAGPSSAPSDPES